MSTNGWTRWQLGDLFEIKHGFAFKGEHFSFDGSHVLLTPGNFQEAGGLQLKGEKEKYYTGPIPAEFVLRKGDLIIAMTDLTQNAPILGSSAVIPQDDRFLHNQRLGKIINIRTERVLPEFLFYLFNTRDVRAQIKGSASGATVRHTSPAKVYKVSVELPPVPEQRRIAATLASFDRLILNNEHRIGLLDEMVRIAYRDCLQSKCDGRKSWATRPLGQIAEEIRKHVPKGTLDETSPYVGLEHLPRRSLALDCWEMATMVESGKLSFKKGDLLFGKIRPYFHKVSVAPFDGVCSADTIVIRSRCPEDYALVVGCVSSDEFVAHASATAHGAKMPRANWTVLERYELAVPGGPTAERFSAIVKNAVGQQAVLVFQNQALREMRALLLPRLLSRDRKLEKVVVAA